MSYDLYPYQSDPKDGYKRSDRRRETSRRHGDDSRSKNSQKSSRDSGFSEEADLDPNFISLMITVYRNGDEFDKGSRISVTRKNFKHWLVLLDHIGERTKFNEPVNRLYTVDGKEAKGFRDLEDDGRYVAIGTSRFKRVRYGADRRSWNNKRELTKRELKNLDSPESVEIFLKKQGYKAKTDKAVFYDYEPGTESAFDLRGEYGYMTQKRATERHKKHDEKKRKSPNRDGPSFGSSSRGSRGSFGSRNRSSGRSRYPGSYERGSSNRSRHSKADRFYDEETRKRNTKNSKGRSRSYSPYAYYTYN